jgi:rSAM/selenodomain-associated transferase 2
MINLQNKITVIIPVLNESERIKQTLLPLTEVKGLEIIVVDGGSSDQTVAIAASLGVRVVSSDPGRGQQMNFGAKIAQGDLLLFLHGDTRIFPDYFPKIVESLSNSDVVAGAFQLGIEGENWMYRLLEMMVNWRSQFFSLPYGDQGIFLKKALFWEIGGFKEIAIMEDFDLIQRLKKRGKIMIISHQIITSDRRWRKLGILKTTLINQLVIIGYYLGFSPDKLRKLYQIFE